MSSSPDGSVLVVDPVSSGALYAPILAEAGVTVHLLDTRRAAVAGLRSGPTPGAVDLEADLEGDPARLAEFCRDRGVGYVVTGSESCVLLCDRLREDLGLTPRSSMQRPERRVDKAAMAAAIGAAGLPTLATLTVPPGAAVPKEAYGRLRRDGAVVVKPAIGAGSVDVRVARDERELLKAVTTIHASAGFFGDHPAALVQELYPGARREYVVDSFSHGEEHEVLTVSRYDKRLSASGDFVYERIRWLSPDGAEAVRVADHAVEVLRALGTGVGAAHLEVMDGDLGPRLIDFGARAHGAGQPLKTFRLTGTSQIHRECEFAVARLHDRAGTGAVDATLPGEGAIVFFSVEGVARCVRTPSESALLEVDGVLEASVHARAGATYRPTRSLLDSLQLGLAFVTAPTGDALDDRCEQVRTRFAAAFETVP